MGVTVIGRTKEEIDHLTKYAKENIKDIKSFLIIYLTSQESDEEASGEIEESVRDASGNLPYEIETFTGSPDMALETFLARRDDIRMVFLHVKKMDIKEILEDDEYTVILKKLEKGVIKTPVVFVPHR